MRLRNLKNKKAILEGDERVILNPKEHISSWSKVFGNKNPIHLEIGIGKGRFIIELAKMNPNINYLGIEKQDSVLAKAVKNLPAVLDNIRLIRLDAFEIDEVFNKEIELLYLNFSDPWPKKRHARRRLTSPDYLEKYQKIFKKELLIKQKTDNQLLFESSLKSYSQLSFEIEAISLDLHHSEIDNPIFTEYEEKFKDKLIYYVSVKK